LQVLARLQDLRHRLPLIAVECAYFQQLREPENRVQRRAELVTHPRQKLALGAVGLFGLFLRPPQRHGQPLAFGDLIGAQLFSQPPIRYVQQHGPDAGHLAGAVVDEAVIDFEAQIAAVAPEKVALEWRRRFLAGQIPADGLAALLLLVRDHQLPHRFPHHLLAGIAQHAAFGLFHPTQDPRCTDFVIGDRSEFE
jgi:hypothetical protein